jgi:arylsulfatase A-like enzyme
MGGKPNVVLAMTDDQGWGDTGYNGHPVLQTPALDAMAANGVQFNRFYSAAPVCSPTRGSCITGRHPFRYGIFYANEGHMRAEEITLAEALKTQGYVTGHFGKWHLGTLTRTEVESNRGGRQVGEGHYSPPWENGFDTCFSTEAKVPTCDPMITPDHWDHGPKPGEPFNTHYWTGPGQKATENLDGDDSRVIMDRVVPFVRRAVEQDTPFLAVVWFHTPHRPVVAEKKHRRIYRERSDEEQHYYGCLTAMDEQMGRLRRELRDLGVADNTMLWFCSDNGPAPSERPDRHGPQGRCRGSTGDFRGRKTSLYEGGVRVPGLLEWPERVTSPLAVETSCSTSDYFPTVLDALGFQMDGQPEPLDGVSLLPVINSERDDRPLPIGFESRSQMAFTRNRYKLISQDGGDSWELYDLIEDPGEQHSIAARNSGTVAEMRRGLAEWRRSCRESLNGNDYYERSLQGD